MLNLDRIFDQGTMCYKSPVGSNLPNDQMPWLTKIISFGSFFHLSLGGEWMDGWMTRIVGGWDGAKEDYSSELMNGAKLEGHQSLTMFRRLDSSESKHAAIFEALPSSLNRDPGDSLIPTLALKNERTNMSDLKESGCNISFLGPCDEEWAKPILKESRRKTYFVGMDSLLF